MNEPVIADLREHPERVARRRNPVLLLTTTGARSGRPSVTPLNYSRAEGDRFVVIASSGGSARHPGWYHNLVADPRVTVELPGETFLARARVASEPERTRLYDAHARAMPFFDGYRRRVKAREIPVVVLERID